MGREEGVCDEEREGVICEGRMGVLEAGEDGGRREEEAGVWAVG